MVFTIYGHGGHLGHVTRTIWTNFRSPILRSLHMKFEFIWPSGFRGEDVWKCWRTTDGRRSHLYTNSSPQSLRLRWAKNLCIPWAVIHLQFWAYGSWDSLFPKSMSPTANLWVQNTIFKDKSAILLHPWTCWNKNFASQRQNYAQKMQVAQVTKSLLGIPKYSQ